MKAIFFILFFCQIIGGGASAEVVLVDLTGDPGYLPYETQSFSHFRGHPLGNRGFGPSGVLFDVDGDGFQDWIRSNNDYVCAVGNTQGSPVTYYQTNLPPEFCREEGPSFSLSQPMDLDGDGVAEIVITGHTEDHWGWRFWIIDPGSGDIKGSFDLDGGEEVRADQRWDGNYIVKGMLDFPMDGVVRTALVLCVNVGFDLEGRGVLAVDPWTGEILWRFVTGPNPLGYATEVVDLEGDGNREVVVYGRAPDNLGGRKINGYSDNESRLFVLDNKGELLWTRRLGGWFGSGYLITSDLTGDGTLEIITSTYTTPEVWGEIVVWSHDGTSLARHTAPDQYVNIALFPGREAGTPRLAVPTQSGFIKVFAFASGELELVAEIETGATCYINCVADILPADGVELVFTTLPGTTWVLDREFHPLTRSKDDKSVWHTIMTPWKVAADVSLLMRGSGASFPFQFAKAPAPPVNIALVISLGAISLFIVAGFILRKRIPTSHRGDPTVLREVRLNLLEDLELSNHGAIAPLKSLRRLVWHLNAMISGLGDNESIEVRLRETWTECVDNALPHLAGILDRARLAGLASSDVDYAARAVDRIALQLDALAREEFRVSCFGPVAAEMTSETAKADDALQDLRREVTGFFRTDLATTVTRVLRANSQAVDDNGVTVQTGYLAQMAAGGDDGFAQSANPTVTCLIDPKELDFVLDNLVGNAVRAMRDAPNRNLAVTWSLADGIVTVDVRDTGCGIPDEHHDRIMDTHFSTRLGGGEGLPRSRKILRKYGGGLMILETTPGHGTTFRITLPTA